MEGGDREGTGSNSGPSGETGNIRDERTGSGDGKGTESRNGQDSGVGGSNLETPRGIESPQNIAAAEQPTKRRRGRPPGSGTGTSQRLKFVAPGVQEVPREKVALKAGDIALQLMAMNFVFAGVLKIPELALSGQECAVLSDDVSKLLDYYGIKFFSGTVLWSSLGTHLFGIYQPKLKALNARIVEIKKRREAATKGGVVDFRTGQPTSAETIIRQANEAMGNAANIAPIATGAETEATIQKTPGGTVGIIPMGPKIKFE
jgi:hypothetical protein